MATIRINMQTCQRREGTDIEKLKLGFPLAGSLTEKLLGQKRLHHHKRPLKERMQEWQDIYHQLLLDASLDELEAVWRSCPDASSVQAVDLRMRIETKRRSFKPDGDGPSPASPPFINGPA